MQNRATATESLMPVLYLTGSQQSTDEITDELISGLRKIDPQPQMFLKAGDPAVAVFEAKGYSQQFVCPPVSYFMPSPEEALFNPHAVAQHRMRALIVGKVKGCIIVENHLSDLSLINGIIHYNMTRGGALPPIPMVLVGWDERVWMSFFVNNMFSKPYAWLLRLEGDEVDLSQRSIRFISHQRGLK